MLIETTTTVTELTCEIITVRIKWGNPIHWPCGVAESSDKSSKRTLSWDRFLQKTLRMSLELFGLPDTFITESLRYKRKDADFEGFQLLPGREHVYKIYGNVCLLRVSQLYVKLLESTFKSKSAARLTLNVSHVSSLGYKVNISEKWTGKVCYSC